MRYPSESGPHVAGPTRWKRCSACGHVKPAPEFFASRFTRDGITDRCRRCAYDAAARDRAERERRRERATAGQICDQYARARERRGPGGDVGGKADQYARARERPGPAGRVSRRPKKGQDGQTGVARGGWYSGRSAAAYGQKIAEKVRRCNHSVSMSGTCSAG